MGGFTAVTSDVLRLQREKHTSWQTDPSASTFPKEARHWSLGGKNAFVSTIRKCLCAHKGIFFSVDLVNQRKTRNFYIDSGHKVTQIWGNKINGDKINGMHLLSTYYQSDNNLGIYLQNITKPKSCTFENVNCTLWQEAENNLYA